MCAYTFILVEKCSPFYYSCFLILPLLFDFKGDINSFLGHHLGLVALLKPFCIFFKLILGLAQFLMALFAVSCSLQKYGLVRPTGSDVQIVLQSDQDDFEDEHRGDGVVLVSLL